VLENSYKGAQFTGMAAQTVDTNPPTHEVIQAVVSFPGADEARKSYDQQMFGWEGCKGRFGATYDDGASYGFDVGVELTKDGVVSMRLTPVRPEVPGLWCDRAMTLRNNVIVDVRACSRMVGDAGATIARMIGDKIAPAS
jgi:serine/threonine-protein kinase